MNDFERFVDWANFLGVDHTEAFHRAADLFDHYGIEGVECGDLWIDYLNQGDTYDCTLVLDCVEGLIVTSWGDWYEQAENAYCESHGVIRCTWCGEFTDCEDDWRDTVCENCGNRVA